MKVEHVAMAGNDNQTGVDFNGDGGCEIRGCNFDYFDHGVIIRGGGISGSYYRNSIVKNNWFYQCGSAVRTVGPNVIIEANDMKTCGKNGHPTIYLAYGSHYIQIVRNWIFTASAYRSMIYSDYSGTSGNSHVLISGNHCEDTATVLYWGVIIYYPTVFRIVDNFIYNYTRGLYIYHGTQVVVAGNNAQSHWEGGYYGIYIDTTDRMLAHGNFCNALYYTGLTNSLVTDNLIG
jgi:hypothetical protein